MGIDSRALLADLSMMTWSANPMQTCTTTEANFTSNPTVLAEETETGKRFCMRKTEQHKPEVFI